MEQLAQAWLACSTNAPLLSAVCNLPDDTNSTLADRPWL
jgi:hypothetical protein